MFQQAGIAGPPKTMDELMADAKKLTVRNPDGRIKVAGFVPLRPVGGAGARRPRQRLGRQVVRRQRQGRRSATDPGWASALQWQKQLIDWYGYDNIDKFFAANTHNEFNPRTRSRPARWR